MAEPYVYAGRTPDELDRKAHQAGGVYDSFIKPTARKLKVLEGETCLRIMPPTWAPKFAAVYNKMMAQGKTKQEAFEAANAKYPGEAEAFTTWKNWWNLDVYLHRNVGPDSATYLCLDKMQGKPCPVCEARSDAEDDEERYQLKEQWRGLAYVINRDQEKFGPQVWEVPVTLFRELNQRSNVKRPDGSTGVIALDHEQQGYDIVFTRTGNDIKTKYSGIEIMRESSPLHSDPDTIDRWMAQIEEHPLPSVLQYYDYEQISKTLYGRVSAREEQRTRRARDPEQPEPDRPRRARLVDEEETTPAPRAPRARASDSAEEAAPRATRRARDVDVDSEPSPRQSRQGNGRDDPPWSEEPESTPRRTRAALTEEVDDEPTPAPTQEARERVDRMRSRRGQ